MLPRNWPLMLIAIILAIALFIFVNGCASARLSSGEVRLSDDDNFVVAVPRDGFLFEAGMWWTAHLPERPGSAVAVTLVNGVHPAQVLVAVRSDDGRPLAQIAEDMRRIETVGERRVSEVDATIFGNVRRTTFSYRSSYRDSAGDRLVERFTIARSADIPGKLVEFYGAWTEDDDSRMSDDMDVMASTLQAMPPAMLESYRRSR